MDWNARSPSQWDWEHLFVFNVKARESPKLQPPEWSGEANQEIGVGSFHWSGGSGFLGSELVHAASSRSTKSGSINSSSNRDGKTSTFNFESSQEDSSGKIELSDKEPVETSHALDLSSVSVEPLLSLKLGKRLYFEDVFPDGAFKNSSLPGVPMSSSTVKKSKSNGQNLQHPLCQVEGCGLDLSSAKDYHRKHRVCESHSKSPKVVVAGLERRFCQQCSRFHGLSEFDEKKRSCRRRLLDHNARRRKPLPEAVQLNQSALSYSSYDERKHLIPFTYSRTATNLAWQDIHNSKLSLTRDFLMKPAKAFKEIPCPVNMLSDHSNCCFASKHIATMSINPGIEDSITSSDPNATQDFHRALSLLSTNSWGAHEAKSISVECYNNKTSTSQPITSTMSQCFPLASSEYWHTDWPQFNSSTFISYSNCNDSNRFQDFQRCRAPFESGFPCNQLD